MNTCSVEKCNGVAKALGFCMKHYNQITRFGRIKNRTNRDAPKIIQYEDWIEIEMYSKDGSSRGWFKISNEDKEEVMKHRWSITIMKNHSYVASRIDKKLVLLHRFILKLSNPKILVDHKNHDGLDCRRENIRIADKSQNNQNMIPRKRKNSKFKGVRPRSDGKGFYATITFGKVRRNLGYFLKEEDAAKAYDKEAKKLFGEYAYTNEMHLTGTAE